MGFHDPALSRGSECAQLGLEVSGLLQARVHCQSFSHSTNIQMLTCSVLSLGLLLGGPGTCFGVSEVDDIAEGSFLTMSA